MADFERGNGLEFWSMIYDRINIVHNIVNYEFLEIYSRFGYCFKPLDNRTKLVVCIPKSFFWATVINQKIGKKTTITSWPYWPKVDLTKKYQL